MVGFYEEMANFAAMSEDVGFLGQCAGESPDPCAPVAHPSSIAPVNPAVLPRRPRQLQLLAIPEAFSVPGTERTS